MISMNSGARRDAYACLIRQLNACLDSYYDPKERKYYIMPQSVEAVIQKEIQRANKSSEVLPIWHGLTRCSCL